MADENIDLLTACLWDLRSQCESQVRTLSAAQRLLDEYRLANRDMSRKSVVGNLRENVRGLTAAGAAIEEVLAEVRRQIGALAPVIAARKRFAEPVRSGQFHAPAAEPLPLCSTEPGCSDLRSSRPRMLVAFCRPATATPVPQRVPNRHNWHRSQCAHHCAQTRSDDCHPAANGNQTSNKKRA